MRIAQKLAQNNIFKITTKNLYRWFQNSFAGQFWPSCQKLLRKVSFEFFKIKEPARKGNFKPFLAKTKRQTSILAFYSLNINAKSFSPKSARVCSTPIPHWMLQTKLDKNKRKEVMQNGWLDFQRIQGLQKVTFKHRCEV